MYRLRTYNIKVLQVKAMLHTVHSGMGGNLGNGRCNTVSCLNPHPWLIHSILQERRTKIKVLSANRSFVPPAAIMLVICICLYSGLTKMAYWQTVSNTCEWGQHYIEQLVGPLPNTGRQTDFCHLVLGGSHADRSKGDSIWRMMFLCCMSISNSVCESFPLKTKTLSLHTTCLGRACITRGDTVSSSPSVCDGKPLNP